MRDFRLFEAITYFLKYLVPITLIVTGLFGCYWKLYAEPKVDEKIQPLIVGIFEIQTTLNKIIPENIREEVQKEVESFEKLFKKN